MKNRLSFLQCTEVQYADLSASDLVTVLGTLANSLIRETLEASDLAVPRVCGVCAVAERMGLDADALHQFDGLDEEQLQRADAALFQTEQLSDEQLDDHIRTIREWQSHRDVVLRIRQIVETELEGSQSLVGAGRLIDAGVDPQTSDRYRQYLSWLETAVCRRAKFPEDPEEIGFGEVPESAIAGEFAQQCDPSVYDGRDDDGFKNPKHWSRPVCIVSREDLNTSIISIEALRGQLKELGERLVSTTWEARRHVTGVQYQVPVTRGLRGLTGYLLRSGEGVVEWKLVQRSPRRQMERADDSIRRVYAAAKRVRTALQARERIPARDLRFLEAQCDEVLGRNWQAPLWNDFQPRFTHWKSAFRRRAALLTGMPLRRTSVSEAFEAPELSPVHRLVRQLGRQAAQRGSTMIGIAWVRGEALPEDIRARIGSVIDASRWAVQVLFDPYESGHLDRERVAQTEAVAIEAEPINSYRFVVEPRRLALLRQIAAAGQ